MYKITINGIAAIWNMNNKIIDFIKKSNLIIFLVDFSCSALLILIENRGNSAISNIDNITVIARSNSNENSVLYWLIIIGKEAINIAAAGVGSPINEDVCLWSILNFAKRIDEKMGSKKAI